MRQRAAESKPNLPVIESGLMTLQLWDSDSVPEISGAPEFHLGEGAAAALLQ